MRIFSLVLSVMLAGASGFVPANALKGPDSEPSVYIPRRACLTEEAMLRNMGQRHRKLRDMVKSCSGAENVEECLVVKIRARDEARKKQFMNLILLVGVRERLPELTNIIALQYSIAASSRDEENAAKLEKVKNASDEAVRSFDEAIAYINKTLNDE